MFDLSDHSLHITAGKLVIAAGWYSGDAFKLFSATAIEVMDDWTTVLEIQMFKFAFTIAIS